jgi:ketosteroid isomerase-like protein
MSGDEHASVVAAVFAAFNDKDMERLNRYFHEDYARTAPPGQTSVSSSDARLLIDDLVADDTRVAVHFTLVGRHKATVMGVPPTGRSIARSTMAIFTFKDGRIHRSRMVADLHGLLLQLRGEVEPPPRPDQPPADS